MPGGPVRSSVIGASAGSTVSWKRRKGQHSCFGGDFNPHRIFPMTARRLPCLIVSDGASRTPGCRDDSMGPPPAPLYYTVEMVQALPDGPRVISDVLRWHPADTAEDFTLPLDEFFRQDGQVGRR